MASGVVQLFCEDSGHERFLRPLIQRVAQEERVHVDLSVGSARGGIGRALAEFVLFQRMLRHAIHNRRPDLLVLVVDANCTGWNERRRELQEAIDLGLFPRAVVGVPDPHVERWCIADPLAFQAVVGTPPPPDPGKCERDLYKRLLANALDRAEIPVLTGPTEIAPDLVEGMDWTTIDRNCPSLAHLVSDLRSQIRQFAPR